MNKKINRLWINRLQINRLYSIRLCIIILCIITLMFAEYRLIMNNIKPYRGERGTVYLEVFGQIDEYYAEDWNLGN